MAAIVSLEEKAHLAFAFTYQGETRPKGWTISGGGQRPHESVRAATEREITEETGLDPATDLILLNRTPIDIPGRAGKINKFSIYVLRVDRDEYARRNIDVIFANRTARSRAAFPSLLRPLSTRVPTQTSSGPHRSRAA